MFKKFVSLCFIFLISTSLSQSVDFKFLKTLNKNEYPLWDKTMIGTSASVYVAMPISIITIAVDGFINKDELMKRNAVKGFLSLGLAGATTIGLKLIISRTRPFVKYPNDIIKRDHAGKYSFPSGHSSSAFATATLLSLSYKKWYVTAPSFLYAGLVGYSRMRLGVHYPSDVLGGMLIGVGAGLLTWKLDQVFFNK